MLRSLREHAERRGQIAPLAVDGQEFKWAHRIAALVHGWTMHAHHYADHPLMLSDVDYDAALALAEAGSIRPHPEAVAQAPQPLSVPDPAPELDPEVLHSDESEAV